MGRPALEVADIFLAHGPAWRQEQRGHLSLGVSSRSCRPSNSAAARRWVDTCCAVMAAVVDQVSLQLVPYGDRSVAGSTSA